MPMNDWRLGDSVRNIAERDALGSCTSAIQRAARELAISISSVRR